MAKLYFRYGAMNSGKSTALMQVAYNYEEHNRKVVVMKSCIDTKGKDTLVSRIGITRKVDILLKEDEKVFDYCDLIKDCSAILVDEVQFLKSSQVEELWYLAHIYDIPVLGYGLKSDFKTNSFEGSRRMFELADEITELVTICDCGVTARFTGRKVNGKFMTDGEQNVIDGEENVEYVPMCADCYLKNVKKMNKIKKISIKSKIN